MQTYIKDCSNVSTKPVYAEVKSLNLAEYLKAARNVIEKPENWTQGVSARDKLGAQINQLNPAAVRFCTVGALDVAKNNWLITEQELSINEVIDYLETFITGSVTDFNDSSTHAEVLELFDKAIAKAELNKLD